MDSGTGRDKHVGRPVPSLVQTLALLLVQAPAQPVLRAAEGPTSVAAAAGDCAGGSCAPVDGAPRRAGPEVRGGVEPATGAVRLAGPPAEAAAAPVGVREVGGNLVAPEDAGRADADGGDPQAPWAVGGFVDTQYIVNSNSPDNHIFRGTSVSSRTGEFSPNLIVAYIRRDPVKSPWMFELALQAGAAADALYYAEPVAGGTDGRFAGVETWKHIGKAWTGLKLKRGTEIAAGLMVAPTHFGSFWTKDNWHSSITWGYSSVPFFLTGARVYQPIGDKVGIGLWLVNGYGTMGDGNKAPSGLLNLVILPSSSWAIVNNLYVGPEDVELKPAAWRVLIDSQVVYNTERWGLAFVGDYGRERLTFKAGRPLTQWANAMLSVRWHVLGKKHRWGMAARPELFWDRGGRIFNESDRDDYLVAGTFTNDLRLWDTLLLRVEYRYDHSFSQSGFFYRGTATSDTAMGLAHTQHSLIFNVIGYFERRFGTRRG